MEYRIPKKLAMINDLTGYGRCSLAVAIPIVSAMGVQACPAPTSIFSNHMAFPVYHATDYTKSLPDYLRTWEELAIDFDGIFCGFLGNRTHIDTICRFLADCSKKSSPVLLIDPVMGDHGTCYSSVTPDYVEAIKKLSSMAQILTPNLTEICLLTDTPYPHAFPEEKELFRMTEKMHALGVQKIAVTGLFKDGCFYNYISEKSDASGIHTLLLSTPEGGPSRPGTGDIFASILAADSVNHVPFQSSVQKAAEFIRICTEGSAALHNPVKEGVCFENYLSLLTQKSPDSFLRQP